MAEDNAYLHYVSHDPAFPISIDYPETLDYSYDSRKTWVQFYSPHDSGSPIVLAIALQDLIQYAKEDPDAGEVLAGRQSIHWYMVRDFEWRKGADFLDVGEYRVFQTGEGMATVGPDARRVPRIVWTNRAGHMAGECVYFVRGKKTDLWVIRWYYLAGFDTEFAETRLPPLLLRWFLPDPFRNSRSETFRQILSTFIHRA